MEWADAVGAFEQALQRFREVLAEPETTVVRDAAIKRFEFTFESLHTYDERTAQKIYNGLRDYLPLLEQLHQGLSRHLGAK